MDLNFQTTELVDENGLIDENTKVRHDILQTTLLWNLPTILIISLKRFSYNGTKNNKLIDFPVNDMNMNKYVSGYKKENHYELFGVCNHSGVSAGGHYTCYVKTFNKKWYLFNDQMVTEIKDNLNQIITAKAYCLFYRLKN
jgi:ubiquitin carboxyl-terminal hydrolase 8